MFDFEAVAQKVLPPAHFGYLATGVDDDATLRANREGFGRLYLRPRRLVDVSQADQRQEIFGQVWESPLGLAPVGNQKAFHGEGEIAVARAAKSTRTLMILSTATNTSVEQIRQTLGAPPWYQLYASSSWEVTERLVKRVEAAGCPVLVLTVDTQAGRHAETYERLRRLDQRDCKTCHPRTPGSFFQRKPMFEGVDTTQLRIVNPSLNWKDLSRLRSFCRMKLVVKGIETAEDARLCVEAGVDGLVVSNHGGRAAESGRGTIDCLPEVMEAVGGQIPVFLDGGIRRGTDILKALALGAKAVFIGRPYIWGLAAFGQAGVEAVIQMLRRELDLVMRQCGVTQLSQISRALVGFHSSARHSR
ncbi:MAG: alpha-hydroxy-acid oxidizing protein [Bryobacteraceae bacterium]|nr:alpha-hydroxy-acid oxidizing protein [Bryobacteraceae bacterium]MDW8378213.1 alpha-hydroxy acid oxidase [Bryobacterales bacterium]